MCSDRLTILLTLKGRDEFTYRWICYMEGVGCPYQIIIADGGQNEEIEKYLSDQTNFPNLRITYIRYPYDLTISDYYEKFLDALTRVKTAYVLMADNDDFYLMAQIADHIRFLDDNEGYIGSRGAVVNLTLLDRNGAGTGETTGEGYVAVEARADSLDLEQPLDRIEALCTDMSRCDYYANWYSVFRTEAFLDVRKKLHSLPIRDVIVNEILTHVFVVERGKLRIADTPYYIRQAHSSMFGDTLVEGNKFLERVMVSGALSEFEEAFRRFYPQSTTEVRERMLRAVATWLNTFLGNIYLSRAGSVKTGCAFALRRWIERSFAGPLLKVCRFRIRNFVRRRGLAKSLRIPEIEPYVYQGSGSTGSGTGSDSVER